MPTDITTVRVGTAMTPEMSSHSDISLHFSAYFTNRDCLVIQLDLKDELMGCVNLGSDSIL